jgi:predicted GNAT family acetyltransferase
MTDSSLTVVNNEAAEQFEMHVDGLLSLLAYKRSGDCIIFTHTEVPAALEGRGIASVLARTALDDARARQLLVVPLCPFVRAYIERHPEYRALVTAHASPEA